MKILICEDEEIMLTALEFRLRKHGFTSVLAEDGRQALDILQQEMPDLIVADIMMPYITGLQLIEHVRTKLNSKVPIIVISALDDDATVLEAFRLGANDFIAKPFKPNELILRIKRLKQELEMAE
ncbi:MAG: response regulator transcription factor [Saprospiraceae bacterium]